MLKHASNGQDHTYVIFGVYFVAFVLFLFISALLFRAHAMGNMILLSANQFPELHAMVVEGAEKLEMKKVPDTFLAVATSC